MYVIRNIETKELIGKQEDTTMNIARVFSLICQCDWFISAMGLNEKEYEILEVKPKIE